MRRATLWGIIGLLLWATDALAQESVRLRSSARVPAGTTLTLSDIAKIDGTSGSTLATVEIPLTPGAKQWTTVTAADVRRALESSGASRASYTLQGSSCAVRFIAASPPATVATVDRSPTDERSSARSATVRDRVETRIQSALGVGPERLRLSFGRTDSALLGRPIGADRVDVSLTSTARSKGLRLRVLIFEGPRHERLLVQESMIVEALVQRDVLKVTRRIRRGEPIRNDDVTYSTDWVNPSVEPLTRDGLGDLVASKVLGPDTILTPEMVRRPVLIDRNQLITVFFVGDGLTMEITSRALESGRMGELIECRAAGGDRTFHARVDGRSRAVISSVTGGTDDGRHGVAGDGQENHR